MSYPAFRALVRRDLRLFFQDRRAVTMSFVAPIVIGSFFGYVFGSAVDRTPSKIEVAVVNQDVPVTARGIEVNAGQLFVQQLQQDRIFDWRFVDLQRAQRGLQSGDMKDCDTFGGRG